MKGARGYFFVTVVAVVLALLPASAIAAGLKVGFYNKSCPSAEALVQQAVAAAFKNNSSMAAGLIRLHFMTASSDGRTSFRQQASSVLFVIKNKQ
jgi:peroxidase